MPEEMFPTSAAPSPLPNYPNSPDLDPSVKAVATPGAPADQKPSFWRTLLSGALNGLAGSAGAKSFGAGLGSGAAGQFAREQQAVENARENAKVQSDIKFRDVQSATAAANAARQDQAMHNETEELQMKRDEFARQQVEFNQKLGISYKPIPNTAENAKQYLEQASANDPNGAHVPSGIIVSPSTLYVPVEDGENGPLKDYNFLQKMGALHGLPVPSRSDYLSANPQQRRLMLEPVQNLSSGHGRNGEPLSPQELPSAVASLETNLKNYKVGPNADPEVAAMGDKTLALLKDQLKAQKAEKEEDRAFQLKLAQVRGQAYGENRLASWLDAKGVLHQGFAKNMPEDAAPVAAGVAAQKIDAQFKDIESASTKVRDAINKMEKLTPENIAKLSAAMQEGHGITKDQIKSLGMNSLSPAQEDFVVWATQLNERAMSLRNIASMGQGAQDLREAIKATLASAGSGNKRIMLKQQDAFDNQVAKLRKGVPKTPAMAKEEQTGGTVKMKAPNGQIQEVSADQVEHFKSRGATVVNQ